MYRHIRRLMLMPLAALLAACGSGTSGVYGGSGGGNPPDTAKVQGIWSGSMTVNGQSGATPILAVIAQGGVAFYYDASGNLYLLPILTGKTTLSGTLTAYAAFGTTFPDGHAKESFSLAGTASDTAITGTFSGNGETGSFALTPLVTQTAGIIALSGTLQGFYLGAGSTAVSLTLQGGGVLAGNDANGCSITGSFTTIQTADPALVGFTLDSSGSSSACIGHMTGLGFLADRDLYGQFGGAAGNYLYLGASNSKGAFVAELKL